VAGQLAFSPISFKDSIMTGWRKRQIEDDDDIQEYVRPWVGLTDEERQEIHGSTKSPYDDLLLLEAILKEKNT
jgi:hypothetical protein